MDHDTQVEKMQRHITEVCDRECREQNFEWMKRLQAEREDRLHREQVRKKMSRPKAKPQENTK